MGKTLGPEGFRAVNRLIESPIEIASLNQANTNNTTIAGYVAQVTSGTAQPFSLSTTGVEPVIASPVVIAGGSGFLNTGTDLVVYNTSSNTIQSGDLITVINDYNGKNCVIDSNAGYKSVTFTLSSGLTTGDQETSGTIFDEYGAGQARESGTEIRLHNLPNVTGGYTFFGDSGNYGIADWREGNLYQIVNIHCPTGS